MEMSLERLTPGLRGEVIQINAPEPLRCRLRDFGLVPGTEVSIRYRSPDGGVTALQLRGTVVAVRSRELKKIRVRLI